MLNKICEWIETSVASLRNGVPAAEHPHAQRTPRDGQMRRKRPFEWYEQIYLNSLAKKLKPRQNYECSVCVTAVF